MRYTHQQLEELMSGYGAIDVLWLDGGQVRPPDQDIRMHQIAAMARAHQPGLIIADRTVGGVFEDFVTPEQLIPDTPPGVPWESCLTLGRSWKYVPADDYKPASELLRLLVETVAKGGNLLLGVGPTPGGLLPATALARLRELGDWMAVNAEAIYGSRPVPPYRDGEVFFTRKQDWLYAVQFGPRVPEEIVLTDLQPWTDSPVFLLGWDRPLRWRRLDGRVHVALGSEARQAALPEGPWIVKFAGPLPG